MTGPEEVTVEVAAGHLVITTPGRVPQALRETVRALMLCVADNGITGVGGFGTLAMRRRRSQAHQRTLDSIFPPAYRSSVLSSRFELRHGAASRADLWSAAERVLAALDGQGPIRVPVAAADDWIRVLGTARFLYVDRRDRPGRAPDAAAMSAFLGHVQLQIVMALRPELPSGEVLEEA